MIFMNYLMTTQLEMMLLIEARLKLGHREDHSVKTQKGIVQAVISIKHYRRVYGRLIA